MPESDCRITTADLLFVYCAVTNAHTETEGHVSEADSDSVTNQPSVTFRYPRLNARDLSSQLFPVLVPT